MEELLGTLGIDWRLFIGQIVNFILFLIILRAFAYKPILNVLQKRQKRIEEGLENARKQEKRLEEIENERKNVLSDARSQAEQVISDAKKHANETYDRMILNAEKKVVEMGERAKAEIANEKIKAKDELTVYVGDLSVLIAEKIMKKHFDKKDEEELIEKSLKELV